MSLTPIINLLIYPLYFLSYITGTGTWIITALLLSLMIPSYIILSRRGKH
jgi:hypothetical protein